MRVLARALLLPLMAAGCQRAVPIAGEDAGAWISGERDKDRDGLCDDSEIALGSDPTRVDTDGDGLPDALEALSGTDLQDPSDPSDDHVAYFAVSDGARDFELSLTVDQAHGQAAIGQLVSRNAADPESRRAGDFLSDVVAVSAEPPDSVRGIEADNARFDVILDRVRLRYRLHFQSDVEARLFTCAAGLPFDFMVKDDAGNNLAREHYLLVVSSEGGKPAPEQFCRPVACI
jgi:hypothetical protein